MLSWCNIFRNKLALVNTLLDKVAAQCAKSYRQNVVSVTILDIFSLLTDDVVLIKNSSAIGVK